MTKYILKRVLLAILTLIIAVIITFFLLKLINKVPKAIDSYITEKSSNAKNGVDLSSIRSNAYLKFNYHPDLNVFKSFGNYISKIFTHGDFGIFYKKVDLNMSMLEHFAKPLKWTFIVSGIGFLFGSIFGIIFGIFAGYKRGKLPDVALNILSIIFVSIPSFVLAAIILLSFNSSSWPITFKTLGIDGNIIDQIKSLLIPIFIVIVTSFASITYYVRNEVVEVLSTNYVATARSKGFSEIKIFFRHILRNISIPMLTVSLSRFIYILLGTLVIEMFFGVPGTAKMFSLAMVNYEYNIIM
ncbi:MAG: ABC transporter permease, partial [Mollicutes bacterium PWAP]|nr:ABC transporter permease [Mollicutes bacterium PWAP]